MIAELRSEAGARVHAGDLLAQMDDRQLVADLEAARAKTRSTEADLRNWEAEAKVMQSDYERAQKMWDAQIITREQLDHAKYKAEAETCDVQRVRNSYQCHPDGRFPRTGTGQDPDPAPFPERRPRYVRQGQQVAKGARLVWVTAEGPLRCEFSCRRGSSAGPKG